ncbi:hypothetical protein VTN96DRAFT_4247 [Rasamsonia emersonii]
MFFMSSFSQRPILLCLYLAISVSFSAMVAKAKYRKMESASAMSKLQLDLNLIKPGQYSVNSRAAINRKSNAGSVNCAKLSKQLSCSHS